MNPLWVLPLLWLWSSQALAVDNEWLQPLPAGYNASQIRAIDSEPCEIRHSAARLALQLLHAASVKRLNDRGAQLLAGPCFKAEKGKTPYLLRAVTVGGEISAAYYGNDTIITLSPAFAEAVQAPTGHPQHTEVVKSAIVVNLPEAPARVISTLAQRK